MAFFVKGKLTMGLPRTYTDAASGDSSGTADRRPGATGDRGGESPLTRRDRDDDRRHSGASGEGGNTTAPRAPRPADVNSPRSTPKGNRDDSRLDVINSARRFCDHARKERASAQAAGQTVNRGGRGARDSARQPDMTGFLKGRDNNNKAAPGSQRSLRSGSKSN